MDLDSLSRVDVVLCREQVLVDECSASAWSPGANASVNYSQSPLRVVQVVVDIEVTA